MAATITLRVYSGTNAGTESSAQTGIDLISADNVVNSSANRTAHKVASGTNSYEKWLRLRVDVAPPGQVTKFSLSPALTLPTGVTIKYGVTDTPATPTDATSTVATSTLSGPILWDVNEYSAAGARTRYLVLQEQVAVSAATGSIPTDALSFGWTET